MSANEHIIKFFLRKQPTFYYRFISVWLPVANNISHF